MLVSTSLYNICAGAYVLALFLYALNLSLKRERIRQIATTIVALGFLTQTIGMGFRWFEAGLIELDAYRLSTGEELHGIAYWQVLTQHPPWSNLYEIMVYMGWGLILVFLICEVKWKPPFVGVFALLLALTALGIASLTDGKIKPLVPALKSWWIMVHVISASIAYAAGTIGAVSSFLYLVKDESRVPLRKIALWVALVLLASGGLVFLNGEMSVWNMSLFGFICLVQIFVGLVFLYPTKIRSLLPSSEQLDHIAYSNILVSFALMAVVLVTGALWAHYAWGRYWAWDPKETGALVIWITYALYLHTRITYGWAGPKSAVIGVVGFFIIIAGFLGVNLGWFADGLHSYGSS